MNSVLITGGTGTLGHGIVDKLLDAGVCRRICIYSRGEKQQAEMARRYASNFLRFIIGDVRDYDSLRWAMDGCDVVIHAAALKRVEVGVYNPGEMKRTNVDGSENVVWAAREMGVKKAILISTDKAFSPLETNPYGLTKAMAECFFRAGNSYHRSGHPAYSIVRYGNVWCSAGSVVPLWRSILASGGRPAITDPACTRFFMLLREAVDFVLGAVEQMRGGEIFIPHLPAYDLRSLARALVPAIPSDCYSELRKHFDIIGLPDHEKLHESMKLDECSADARRMSIEQLRSHL